MEGNAIAFMNTGIRLSLIVIETKLGIKKLATSTAKTIEHQPSAAAQITNTVNLPLFLLEDVAILAEVFALLIVVLK